MKLATAVLIFSFFLPALCEVGTALSAPAHTCTQHQSQQEDEKEKLACCLLATLDRPAVKEQGRSDGSAVVLDLGPATSLVSPVGFATSSPYADYQAQIDHSPPRLWILNTAFLI